ncbi:hypothetical protein [Microbacterium sp. NPDC055665]
MGKITDDLNAALDISDALLKAGDPHSSGRRVEQTREVLTAVIHACKPSTHAATSCNANHSSSCRSFLLDRHPQETDAAVESEPAAETVELVNALETVIGRLPLVPQDSELPVRLTVELLPHALLVRPECDSMIGSAITTLPAGRALISSGVRLRPSGSSATTPGRTSAS